MQRRTLNLGILAHVDAGKTTLTERLLHAAGVLDTIGSVDAGTTQTDSLALERQRGITIRAAVVSFELAGVTVNLIDTPGHPDFIAEVERVLSLLDGAVLVISAVEGVQPQTRVLMRALRRLRVPTLIFINKIDRRGADPQRVLAAIRGRLTPDIVVMGTVDGPGSRQARFVLSDMNDEAFRTGVAEELAARDDRLLADFVADEAALTRDRIGHELVGQTGRSMVHPVYFGSAITGDGVEALMAAVTDLLPAPNADASNGGPLRARVFKIDRGAAGEKISYVRMFAGVLRVREPVPIVAAAPDAGGSGAGGSDGGNQAKVTAISVAEHGTWVSRPDLRAGEIGRIWGLADARIGDTLGHPQGTEVSHHFAPPTMSTVVSPTRPSDGGALRAALARLAEQDPLINVRADETGREVSVSLYGEVQKEVIAATLATEFGIDVEFRETTTICVERPRRTGEAAEILNADDNPFHAGIGLRVEPAPVNSGITFRLGIDPQTVPLYAYRNATVFTESMGQYVRRALREGLAGWQVTDCLVTMTYAGYSLNDGPPSQRGPLSTPADFRLLTPMVIMRALAAAGTVVCEPTLRVTLEIPVWAISAVMTALGRWEAAVRNQSVRGELTTIEAILPAARAQDLLRQLPALTAGEGVFESTFDGYRATHGAPPTRARTTADPLHREQYIISLTRQGARA